MYRGLLLFISIFILYFLPGYSEGDIPVTARKIRLN